MRTTVLILGLKHLPRDNYIVSRRLKISGRGSDEGLRECNNEAVQDEQSTDKTRNTRRIAAAHSITRSLAHSLTYSFNIGRFG